MKQSFQLPLVRRQMAIENNVSSYFLLAHLSRRLMGELIVYQSFWRPSVLKFQTPSPMNH